MGYRKFVFGETLEKALEAIPEEHQIRFYKIIKNYGLHDIEPELSGFELSTWVQMKDVIDNTMPIQDEDISEARSRAGKVGMKKRWGKRRETCADGDTEADLPITTDNKDNKDDFVITKITGDNKDNKTPNGNVNGNVNVNGSGNQKPPPLEQIKKESKAQGFFLNDATARKFQRSCLVPSWFSGPFSFLRFTAERLKKKYPEKDAESLSGIYIAAVLNKKDTWGDFREEYPGWRENQEKAARETERCQAFSKARDSPPRKCQCGGELNGRLVCQRCGGRYVFEEKDPEQGYVFFPKLSEASFSEDFEKLIKGKSP
jgi:hypothetical protein